jgi:hypothetical protein
LKKQKIKFGVICEKSVLNGWEHAAIEYLVKEQNIELVLIVNLKNMKKPERFCDHKQIDNNKASLSSTKVWKLYYQNIFLKNSKSMIIKTIEKNYNNVDILSLKSKKKLDKGIEFSKNDILSIKKYNLDFILNFIPYNILGQVLTIPTYGVWEFDFNSVCKYSTLPPFFNEFYNNNRTSKATLYRVTNDNRNNNLLFSGCFKNELHSYTLNYDLVFFSCAEWPKKICNEIMAGTNNISKHKINKKNCKTTRMPENFETLKFFIMCLFNKIKIHLNELLYLENWSIGIVNCPITDYIENVHGTKVSWITHSDKEFYWADPFVVSKNSKEYIFFEEYDHCKKKAIFQSVHFKVTR